MQAVGRVRRRPWFRLVLMRSGDLWSSRFSHGFQSVQLVLETLRLATHADDVGAAALLGRLTQQTRLLPVWTVVENLVRDLHQAVDGWIQQ